MFQQPQQKRNKGKLLTGAEIKREKENNKHKWDQRIANSIHVCAIIIICSLTVAFLALGCIVINNWFTTGNYERLEGALFTILGALGKSLVDSIKKYFPK